MQIRRCPQSQMNKFCYSAIILALIGFGFGTADAQQNIAQQAYAIFQQNCLNCHGEDGAYRENLVITSAQRLIATGAVMPGDPDNSEFYKRLIEDTPEKPQMPWNRPPLTQPAVNTIQRWIAAGAPGWTLQHDVDFIGTDVMLTAIEKHLKTLDAFDRPHARYFTTTHLYNAGERPEALRAYHVALSKLVNSLSWGSQIINPEPIDGAADTVFYIDLRNYEWDRREVWPQIEQAYPYMIDFDEVRQANLHSKLANLRQEMACAVPMMYADWFLATASLPPLYHDILALPETERELERELGVDVERNLQSAPGVRVWRAGTNDSGVSNHNRVVERHSSPYGAYWKSHDFASSVGVKNIFTHPLSFDRDGGEVIFNLPNGLQAYYISDGLGNRIDVAPREIVSNPAARDPAVRNGISCIGCHTEGMKEFEDGVRSVVEQLVDPGFDRDHALRLYVSRGEMDRLVREDTRRYRDALEATGGVFGGIEPVHRFSEAFYGDIGASYAAASVGLERAVFLAKVAEKPSLQRFGLAGLIIGGNVKRDVWTSNFAAVVACLYGDACVMLPVPEPNRDNSGSAIVRIPDSNLRAAIAERLGKAPGTPITAEEMATLERLSAWDMGISDLAGLEFATNLDTLLIGHNSIPDLSPIAGLTQMSQLRIPRCKISDISPLIQLKNLGSLEIYGNEISDISPLAGMTNLHWLSMYNNPVSDLSPLANLKNLRGMRVSVVGDGDLSAIAELTDLENLYYWGSGNPVPDLFPLTKLPKLKNIDIRGEGTMNPSPLAGLTAVKELWLSDCGISNLSFLEKLTGLERLNLERNNISDISPLAGLTNLKWIDLRENIISDFSPLAGLAKTTSISRAFNPGAPVGGPKIEGPWLWATVSGKRLTDRTDLLAEVSSGSVTEDRIANFGASEGMLVGNNVWTAHRIPPEGSNNINQMLASDGIDPDENNQVIYGSIILNSPSEQDTTMFVGSDDAVKVWLNGELVYKALVWFDRIHDYQDFFPVRLKQGANTLLVAIDNRTGNEWAGFFGFQEGTKYTALPFNNRLLLSTDTTSVHIDDTFIIRINLQDVTDLAGWQSDIVFDPAVLEAIEVNEGNFLKQKGGTTFFRKGTIDNRYGKIRGVSSARLNGDVVNGTGTLLSVTFSAKAIGESLLTLNNFQFGSGTGEDIPIQLLESAVYVKGKHAVGDVNRDGQVSILDMILVAQHFGENTHVNSAVDVNDDGVVDILDLIIISQHLGELTAAAPSMIAAGVNPAMIQDWIERAQVENDGSIAFREGIENLQRLLALLIPKETALLPNYPNPFNPETWIPYRLSEPADVTLCIYAVNGALVRNLALGQMLAGIYESRTRAAYWDGKNDVGEPVASGVYFYTLTAGDFTATRKMLIRK